LLTPASREGEKVGAHAPSSLGVISIRLKRSLQAEDTRRHTLTSETAFDAVSRVAAGDVKPGFQTPSLAFGP